MTNEALRNSFERKVMSEGWQILKDYAELSTETDWDALIDRIYALTDPEGVSKAQRELANGIARTLNLYFWHRSNAIYHPEMEKAEDCKSPA